MTYHIHFAQGAFVCPKSPESPPAPAGGFAHGALVGAIGPGGNLEVSESEEEAEGGTLAVAAHGAAVGAAASVEIPVAHGALVPDPGPADGGAGLVVDGCD